MPSSTSSTRWVNSRELGHLDRARASLQGMRRPKNLVHRIVIAGIVLESQDTLLERLDLALRLGEKVLQELLIVRVEVVAHRV